MMDVDLTVALIKATVQIDQPINEAKRMVGTGFLISVQKPDGATQIVLVTAAHVFEKMPAADVRIGWRTQAKGNWSYVPANMTIRSAAGPVWYQHPSQDIAVIPVNVPDALRDSAIPQSWLADENTFANEKVGAGDELMTLGYPHGLSANVAGFPILRAGRVASYPVSPPSAYPTFLIDLTAVPGNSGGPVFMTSQAGKGHTFIAGVLIKQVEDDSQRLELGVVTDAVFVRQTIDIMLKAEASGVNPSANLKPAAPAPMRTPGGPTTSSPDMTRRTTARPSDSVGGDQQTPGQ
ncbi:S1 family peptidase [Asticcacaulis sp. AC466]|uniref:S1 family peptidase n=1 Tax=Asticcacaulis sp. AC466 TaxID=1282362 RepID=UPI0004CE34C9|nr:serine protease [Asticcacaulis sp. AC466]